MALMKVTSPHAHDTRIRDTAEVMRLVILATVPGIIALTVFFGWGTLINIMVCTVFGFAMEAWVVKRRKRPVMFYLKDNSALLTAVLLGIALPPFIPWWAAAVGILFAIGIGKQLYGGMGYNPFNPAMVGYVVLLISFPVQMTMWTAPAGAGLDMASFGTLLQIKFAGGSFDAYTMATPLDLALKQNQNMIFSDIAAQSPQFGLLAGIGWEEASLAFLFGGLFLLYKRIYTWHAPVAFLATLTLCSLIGWLPNSANGHGSPLFHLFSGATMLGAFFIVTDPVSSAVTTKGRLVYGACIGLLVYLIRAFGSYPDAVAFAVLLMNFAAPIIDNYTQPRTYGHKKAGIEKSPENKP